MRHPIHPLLVLVGLGAASLALDTQAHAQGCAEPFTHATWSKNMDEVAAKVGEFDLNGAAKLLVETQKAVPCLDTIAQQGHLGRFGRQMSMIYFFKQEEFAAISWANLQRTAAPGLKWDSDGLPLTPPYQDMLEWADEPVLGGDPKASLVHPKKGAVFMNGTVLDHPQAYAEVPSLLQVVDKKGVIVQSYWQDGARFPPQMVLAPGEKAIPRVVPDGFSLASFAAVSDSAEDPFGFTSVGDAVADDPDDEMDNEEEDEAPPAVTVVTPKEPVVEEPDVEEPEVEEPDVEEPDVEEPAAEAGGDPVAEAEVEEPEAEEPAEGDAVAEAGTADDPEAEEPAAEEPPEEPTAVGPTVVVKKKPVEEPVEEPAEVAGTDSAEDSDGDEVEVTVTNPTVPKTDPGTAEPETTTDPNKRVATVLPEQLPTPGGNRNGPSVAGLATGGGLAIVAGVLYGAASVQAGKLNDEGMTYDSIVQARSNANMMVVGSAVAGAAALGIGVTAVISDDSKGLGLSLRW